MSVCYFAICDKHRQCVVIATTNSGGCIFGLASNITKAERDQIGDFLDEHAGACGVRVHEDPPFGYTDIGNGEVLTP